MDAIASRSSTGRSFVRTITLTGSGSRTTSAFGGAAIAARSALNGVVRSSGSFTTKYASANFTSGGSDIPRLRRLRARAERVSRDVAAAGGEVVAERELRLVHGDGGVLCVRDVGDVDERVRPQG